jgi:hypothetical protein
MEIIAVYSEDLKKPINTLCEQSADFFNVEAIGILCLKHLAGCVINGL